MHYDDYGSGTGFGSGYNIKWNKESQKTKNVRPAFWEIMLLLSLKKQDFVQIFVVAKYCLDPEPEPKLFPKSKPKPQ
jgi:hypothetical protein